MGVWQKARVSTALVGHFSWRMAMQMHPHLSTSNSHYQAILSRLCLLPALTYIGNATTAVSLIVSYQPTY